MLDFWIIFIFVLLISAILGYLMSTAFKDGTGPR